MLYFENVELNLFSCWFNVKVPYHLSIKVDVAIFYKPLLKFYLVTYEEEQKRIFLIAMWSRRSLMGRLIRRKARVRVPGQISKQNTWSISSAISISSKNINNSTLLNFIGFWAKNNAIYWKIVFNQAFAIMRQNGLTCDYRASSSISS